MQIIRKRLLYYVKYLLKLSKINSNVGLEMPYFYMRQTPMQCKNWQHCTL